MTYDLNMHIELSWVEVGVKPGEGIASNAKLVVEYWQQYIMVYSVKICTEVHYD